MEKITIEREDGRILFDALSSSLDFGSGFLDTEEVEALRRLAVSIGIDPMEATPSEFRQSYKHLPDAETYQPQRYLGRLSAPNKDGVMLSLPSYENTGPAYERCKRCSQPVNAWVHWPTVESSRSEDGCGSLMCDGECDVCLGLTASGSSPSGGEPR